MKGGTSCLLEMEPDLVDAAEETAPGEGKAKVELKAEARVKVEAWAEVRAEAKDGAVIRISAPRICRRKRRFNPSLPNHHN